jgi:hypothetical protein
MSLQQSLVRGDEKTMDKKDEEIQRKLLELEATVLKETPQASLPTTRGTASGLTANTHTDSGKPKTTVGQDLCYFLGLGLIFTGILMFFNHVRVGTGMLQMLGMGGGGFGLLLIPLMVGLGWLMYDSKSRAAWIITAGTIGTVVFSVLSSLVMSLPQISLLGMIMLLLPFAAGGALLLKGIGGPKAIQDKLSSKE